MEVTLDTINEFASILIKRGFGLYGDDKMMKICQDSGIACDTDGTFSHITEENKLEVIKELIINYAKFNLPAKMTSLVLAKKYGIPIPEELKSKGKHKSKYRVKFESIK
ncbi:MAG: hypothetical protein FK733_13695 [Asgard group archaeon]|nr:hypothetical protein [Asgard group archaeon]